MTIGAPEIITRVIEELGPKEINNGFGLTETAAVSSVTSCSDPLEIRLHKVGRPLPGVEIKIINPDPGKDLSVGEQGGRSVSGDTMLPGVITKSPKRRPMQ